MFQAIVKGISMLEALISKALSLLPKFNFQSADIGTTWINC
jgi:trans-aconitate methyltransferase